MANDDVIILGTGNLKQCTRTNKSGAVKQRCTVEVSGDSILINADPKSLGKGPAETLAKLLRDKVSQITATASVATQKFRAASARAVAAGAQHAMKRYAGGKTGLRTPNQSDRLFNDSGRFRDSIVATANKETWTVNVAANRLDPGTLSGSAGALTQVYRKLLELVPEFGNPRALLDSKEFVDAVKKSNADALVKVSDRNADLKRAKMQAEISLAKMIVSGLG